MGLNGTMYESVGIGLPGPVGADGAPGVAGAIGPEGPAGPAGADGTGGGAGGITIDSYQGKWVGTTTYQPGQLVAGSDGALYAAKVETTGTDPTVVAPVNIYENCVAAATTNGSLWQSFRPLVDIVVDSVKIFAGAGITGVTILTTADRTGLAVHPEDLTVQLASAPAKAMTNPSGAGDIFVLDAPLAMAAGEVVWVHTWNGATVGYSNPSAVGVAVDPAYTPQCFMIAGDAIRENLGLHIALIGEIAPPWHRLWDVASKPSFTDFYKGFWDASVAYKSGQLVTQGTKLLMALVDNLNSDPSSGGAGVPGSGAAPATDAEILAAGAGGSPPAQPFTVNAVAVLTGMSVISPVGYPAGTVLRILAADKATVLGSAVMPDTSSAWSAVCIFDTPVPVVPGTTYYAACGSANAPLVEVTAHPAVCTGVIATVGGVWFGAGYGSTLAGYRMPFRMNVAASDWQAIAG